tara:strand:+ start:410 stop:1105 length:696 start_codon:yes stop_codon:yes gene_type:complete
MSLSKKDRWKMFNTISATYDTINRWMTFGMDITWRKAIIRTLSDSCQTLLDVASGTMDVAITAAKKKSAINSITAMDMASDMLSIGEKKCQELGIKNIKSVVADVHHMPFDDQSFDAITVSFGIRNFEHLGQAFLDMHRVLNPSGELIILETCQPSNKLMTFFNHLYLRFWVQFIANMISGKKDAYAYLSNSIKNFHQPKELQNMLKEAGFKQVNTKYFALKSVQLIHAVK